ncbi:Chelated iron transport system membrane protein yfeD [Vibrio nigripulchritudo MADA3029]|uniref:metal ABC transporter permease n=1 Tax=Vibrio nigripulchritudo TaxID=28173 RepID=UPI00021C2DCF|nr:metal ABC transporter permease [Vibrio nigripulchritudo]EGU57187.1 ABC transporter integral membrane protein [Vibrio nigripulchritudo ATCC 27043]KJY79617.1 iron ABC transporter permease [Vibrio nigripulchritudo]CCN47325.1 Chelated iron transport system membrane protein yfeD [Vibrio nigripulchritudo MADA3020]CCN55190.1 Chelated iron transport system membrane protein yfeD [Vibrio nigripulchritudo MADA3021]CCN60969.1 Chelated iron transport system membrane protein yfeD [Vibrio nigripulchritudo
MEALISWVIEPFQYPFMMRALWAGLAVGGVCAVLSCYLVLKGWSLMGDAISHAVLPGIVVAYVIGIALPIGAFVSGLLCALLTGYIKENSRVKEDTVMGIVFSGMFALGLVMFAKIETEQHLLHILFGNMLGINDFEFWQTVIISVAVFCVMLIFRHDFLLYCFDKSHARVVGLPVTLLHYALLVMLALTIVATIQAVGVIMVVAMLVAPGITAFVLTRKFSTMLWIALSVSIGSTLAGTLISFHIDGATSACIVLVQATCFIVALTYSKVKTHLGKVKPATVAQTECRE